MLCASTSDLLIAQFFLFGNILRKSWETPSFFLVCDENPKVIEVLANLHKASKETRDQACQLITVPAHKIKQINAPLRFTNVVSLS